MKIVAILLSLALATFAGAQGYQPANYSNLQWVNVGPARGGRSIACTGVRSRPNEFYFGAAGGGLWKSTDSGASWNCVSDGFFKTSSVGAVAVSESNPNVVYAGMGEREIRGDIAEGDGVYKSTDAGKTWQHMGLERTRTVSRIVVDPKNPDIVYVAALGKVFGSNAERGVFKSTDGGNTWSRVLFESEKAGAVELVMDPANSSTLYAATWEAWRSPSMMSSGGPGSKLWKTTDGGSHWTDLSRNPGLPTTTLGKIGITVSAADSKRLYAIVEAAPKGGVFRSDDAGLTWAKTSSDSEVLQRAWYFYHVYADPKVKDKVYCLNVGAYRSNDAGATWGGMRTQHSDNHDLWINPDKPEVMIEANDGGASVTTDGGMSWSPQTFATAQIYHVVTDNHIPYRIYGAQQDNSSVRVSPNEPLKNNRNFEGTAGGESGYIAVRSDDPDIAYGGNYGGNITELNSRLGMSRDIDPWPDNPMGHGAKDLKHRFQWTFPIVTSPHDPNVLYTASQYLLKTTNAGQSWQQISPDLTRNDKSKQGSSGGPITQDNTSVEYYDTIFTVAESAVKKGLIWVGSDDGLIHVTQNGGKTWANVTPAGMPTWGRVSMIEASPFEAGTAYAAVNDYQNEDLAPYIYRTRDFGKTWTKIVNGIPSTSFARVCRADLHRAGLLYAGTETGVFVSFDDGEHWQSLQQNLPLCPVHDLALKDDDLIAATHGRSFWVLKGVSRLANLTPSQPAKPLLYQPIDRVSLGSARPAVDYYLPAPAKDVQFTFTDKAGKVLGTVKGDVEAGFHTVSASLAAPGFGTFPGMIFWAGFSRDIPAPPGAYTVKMEVDGYEDSKTFRITKDPRLTASDKDLVEQFTFANRIVGRINEANAAVLRIRDTIDQVDKLISDSKNDASISSEGAKLKEKLLSAEGEIYQYRSRSGQDPLNYPIMLNDRLSGLLGTVLSNPNAPSQQATEVFAELSKLLDAQLVRLKGVEATDISAFNQFLKHKSLPPVKPKDVPLTFGRRRRGGQEEEEEREREENGG